MEENNFKCRLCAVCAGKVCAGELPGMGGVFEGKNHILNCEAWKKIYAELTPSQIENAKSKISKKFFRLAPMTGAQENIGWHDEESFYAPFIKACFDAGMNLSIGDGCPDEKLLCGIQAVKALAQSTLDVSDNTSIRAAAVFLKPYPQEKLFERIEWSADIAEYFGIDIDAYNIVTMRNKVSLEKKSAAQLNALRRFSKKPFIIKGVFTKEDLRLVEECRPDVAIVSNHGGRVETDIGSSAEFLRDNYTFLKKHCGAVWVDGGIRTAQDAVAAAALGAEEILLGRPPVTAFCRDGEIGVKNLVERLLPKNYSLFTTRKSRERRCGYNSLQSNREAVD